MGTKVTVENFMAWRNEFNNKRLQNKKAKKSEGKKTGKILKCVPKDEKDQVLDDKKSKGPLAILFH